MNRSCNHPPRRRGSAYVMVLAISLLVSVIGVAAMSSLRVQIRATANTNDCEEARLDAQSGIELGRYLINNDSSWRTNLTSGGTITRTLGSGTFAVTMIDPVD